MENPWFVFAWGGFAEGGRNSFLKAFPSQDDAIEYVSHLLNEDYSPSMWGSRKFKDAAINKSWSYMQLWNVETDEHYMLFEKWKQQPVLDIGHVQQGNTAAELRAGIDAANARQAQMLRAGEAVPAMNRVFNMPAGQQEGQVFEWRRPVPFEQDNVPQREGVRGIEMVGGWMDEEGDRNMDIIQRLIEDENHRQQNVLLRDVPGLFAAEQRAAAAVRV